MSFDDCAADGGDDDDNDVADGGIVVPLSCTDFKSITSLSVDSSLFVGDKISSKLGTILQSAIEKTKNPKRIMNDG